LAQTEYQRRVAQLEDWAALLSDVDTALHVIGARIASGTLSVDPATAAELLRIRRAQLRLRDYITGERERIQRRNGGMRNEP
jgi:hypothetical protein